MLPLITWRGGGDSPGDGAWTRLKRTTALLNKGPLCKPTVQHRAKVGFKAPVKDGVWTVVLTSATMVLLQM